MSNRPPVATFLSAIGIAAAVALIVSLFLDWYELSADGDSVTLSGWSALEFGDFLFVLIAIAVVVALFSERSSQLVLGCGALAFIFVVLAAITNTPTVEAASISGSVDVSLQAGFFLAAGGAVLLLLSGGLGMAMAAERHEAPTAVGSQVSQGGTAEPTSSEPPTAN